MMDRGVRMERQYAASSQSPHDHIGLLAGAEPLADAQPGIEAADMLE
jgi:hypothetical protein